MKPVQGRFFRYWRAIVSFLLAGSFVGSLATAAAAQESITVTDLAGRMVELHQPPERLVLADGFVINALNVLEPDPVKIMAGWSQTFKAIDPASYARYRRKFPAIDAVPTIGEIGAGGVSLEQIVALRPDLIILPLELSASDKLVQRLEAFKIPVIFVDFFNDPMNDTVPSLRILGEILQRQEKAEAFIAFYEDHMRKLRENDPNRRTAPKVLLQAHAGIWKCCWSPGKASLGAYITLGGGLNIGADPLPAHGGWLSREYVIAANPDVYIATGRPENGANGGLAIGPGVSTMEAKRSLRTLASADDLRTSSAVRENQVYGLWNFFLDTPANIVAAEVIAKWIDPEGFRDIDPDATLTALNGFLAVPMEGTYWTSMENTPVGK
ncbi:MAG: ABC transporter substrate-binding protein [Pseudoxanthomonas sp.]